MHRRGTSSGVTPGSMWRLGIKHVDSRHILGQNAVSSRVNADYTRIRGYFWNWVFWKDLEPLVSYEILDSSVEQYMEFIYAHGWPSYRAFKIVDALVHQNPLLGSKFARSRRAARGLRSLHTTEHHTPVPLDVTWAIAVVLARIGKTTESIAILLAFHCYLRIGEVANLEKQNVVLQGDSRMGRGSRSSITLSSTKTGPDQFVLVKNNMIEELLKRAIELSDDAVFVFGDMTVRSLRAAFKEGQRLIGLSSTEFYNFHGLRGGGCGNDVFREIYTLPEVQLRGRWISLKSFQIYSRRCRAMLAKDGLPRGDAALVMLLTTFSPWLVFGGDVFEEGGRHEL